MLSTHVFTRLEEPSTEQNKQLKYQKTIPNPYKTPTTTKVITRNKERTSCRGFTEIFIIRPEQIFISVPKITPIVKLIAVGGVWIISLVTILFLFFTTTTTSTAGAWAIATAGLASIAAVGWRRSRRRWRWWRRRWWGGGWWGWMGRILGIMVVVIIVLSEDIFVLLWKIHRKSPFGEKSLWVLVRFLVFVKFCLWVCVCLELEIVCGRLSWCGWWLGYEFTRWAGSKLTLILLLAFLKVHFENILWFSAYKIKRKYFFFLLSQ